MASYCAVANAESGGRSRSPAPAGRRRRRSRRRRARFPDARPHQATPRTWRSTHNFTKYTPVGRHRRAAGGDLLSAIATTTACRFRPDEVIVTAGGEAGALQRRAQRSSNRATRSSRTRRTGRRSPSRSSSPAPPGHRPDPAGGRVHDSRRADPRGISPRTKGIVINSPCNPTGALISDEAATRDRRCGRSTGSGSSLTSPTKS